MQPFTAKMLVVSFVGLQLLLFSMRMCAADSNGLDVQICDRLHVGHGSAAHSVNERVTVLLRKTDGTQVTCVEPSQEYKGTHIKTLHDCTAATIMAFHSCTFMTSSWERELRQIHLSSTLYQILAIYRYTWRHNYLSKSKYYQQSVSAICIALSCSSTDQLYEGHQRFHTPGR